MLISVRWLTVTLAAIATALLIVHTSLFWLTIYAYPDVVWLQAVAARFDVDSEASVATWFGQTLLLIASLIALFIAISQERLRVHWYGVTALLLLLSLDEGASFHETLGVWLGQNLGLNIPLGFATVRDWVVLAAIAVSLVGIGLWQFAFKLPSRTRWLLIAGAGLFVLGALGVETLHFTTFGLEFGSFAHRLSNALEEALEMAGTILVIYTLADYAAQYCKPQRLGFYSAATKSK